MYGQGLHIGDRSAYDSDGIIRPAVNDAHRHSHDTRTGVESLDLHASAHIYRIVSRIPEYIAGLLRIVRYDVSVCIRETRYSIAARPVNGVYEA